MSVELYFKEQYVKKTNKKQSVMKEHRIELNISEKTIFDRFFECLITN
jgi:hypothetical protein